MPKNSIDPNISGLFVVGCIPSQIRALWADFTHWANKKLFRSILQYIPSKRLIELLDESKENHP